MKKLILSTLVIVSILGVFFHKNILKACTDMLDPGTYRVTFFSPNLQRDSSNYPFYYSYMSTYSKDEPLNPADTNLGEWENYFQHQSSKKDIEKVVYQLDVKTLEYIAINQKIPDSLSNNKCLHLLIQKKYSEAIGYLIYAKTCEPFVVFAADPWDALPRDTAQMPPLIAKGKLDCEKTKDAFIKLRYAYQIVRLAGYSGDNNTCINLYDKYVSTSKVNSTIKNWTLLIKAVALIKTGHTDEAEYLLSHIFDVCLEKKIVAYQYFRESNNGENNLKYVLTLCANNHEKAVVMAMVATGKSGFYPQGLANVYQYEPNSPLIENLIIREISKAEDALMTRKLYGNQFEYMDYSDDSVFKKGAPGLQDLKNILNTFISENKIKNKALLYLSQSYVSLLMKNTAECDKYLADAKQYCEGDEKMEEERHFLLILNRIDSYKTITPKIENEMYPDLVWLSKCKNYNTVIQPTASFYGEIMRLLAVKYEAQHDLAKAILCYNKSGIIYPNNAALNECYTLISDSGNHQNLAALHDLLYKTSKNNYEKLITDSFQFNKNRMLDFEGTLYLQDFNFALAAEKFSQITNDYWKKDPFKTYLAANSFNVQLFDTHYKTEADTIVYNKYTFCEKMLDLLKKSDAKSLYETANGLYNMDYYGNSWLLVTDSWSGGDADIYNDGKKDSSDNSYVHFNINTKFRNEYFNCTKAKEYYLKAMNAAKDKEFKAECCFMAAKCEQKEKNIYDSTDVPKSEQFEMLRKNFSNTAYYKNAAQQCALLKDFIVYKTQ